jgi:LacI family fructose operon transcriptional repressor
MDPRRQARRTTIYDIAALLGTSPSAVSAVLNGSWQKRRIGKALAERIQAAAKAEGYAVNLQAAGLRREHSRIIGMIVPKYDNRYLGAIAERFEVMARARGLFPIVTCTMRDPKLEAEAAQAMISHQVDWLVATGATDPDRINELCAASGVPTLNLDLPGRRAPSVISDNFAGARDLTARILECCHAEFGTVAPLLFVGGRAGDHNTMERLRGFQAAHAAWGLAVTDDLVLTCGYAAEKVEAALDGLARQGSTLPNVLFVNSTISLEGVVRWIRTSPAYAGRPVRLGCFDYDPFASLLEETVAMVQQDVDGLLAALFRLIDAGPEAAVVSGADAPIILVPPLGPLLQADGRAMPLAALQSL